MPVCARRKNYFAAGARLILLHAAQDTADKYRCLKHSFCSESQLHYLQVAHSLLLRKFMFGSQEHRGHSVYDCVLLVVL